MMLYNETRCPQRFIVLVLYQVDALITNTLHTMSESK